MKETIQKLNKQLDEAAKKTHSIREAIESLQRVCEHDWVDAGHDSHHYYSECSICGKRSRD